ncbi:MAG: hypothetical protein V1859_02545 [archaeon]
MSYVRKKESWRILKSGTRKKYIYYEEVQSERIKGDVVQKFIKHLGKTPDRDIKRNFPTTNNKHTN